MDQRAGGPLLLPAGSDGDSAYGHAGPGVPPMTRPRAAVVGGGVAGLTAAYVLQRHYDVTLFESDHRLGGHAHTHDVERAAGGTVSVDTGFIVHNERTYPQLLRL